MWSLESAPAHIELISLIKYTFVSNAACFERNMTENSGHRGESQHLVMQ